MIEIKSCVDGRVLYTAENATDVKVALEEAVKSGADLRGAVLGGADLSGADLRGAVLRGAVLSGADLSGAVLSGADLSGADLRGAVLRGAVLSGAVLSGADLRGAVLRGAVLSGADLRGAVNHRHPLWAFRVDIFDTLDRAPAEICGLRTSLAEGLVDGSVYEGDCACLVGTIAKVRGVPVGSPDLGVPKDESRPAEQWFMPIRKGDRPVPLADLSKDVSEGVFRASWALAWVDEWIESRNVIAKALVGTQAA